MNPPPEPPPGAEEKAAADPTVEKLLTDLPSPWRLTASQRRQLGPAVAAALAAGWTPADLAEHLSANPNGVRNAFRVLNTRLDALPDAPRRAFVPAARRPWCGECDERTRQRMTTDDRPYRCPECHPAVQQATDS